MGVCHLQMTGVQQATNEAGNRKIREDCFYLSIYLSAFQINKLVYIYIYIKFYIYIKLEEKEWEGWVFRTS